MKLAHIINPVNAKPGSVLHEVQPVTFESIRIAREFAGEKLPVELFSVCYPEDAATVPSFIRNLAPLTRSVLDVNTFSHAKKYPLMIDVFCALYNASDAEYLIYTNMDIALMPQFYQAVSELLKEGYDALLVNRRGISTKYKGLQELPLMYSDYGKPHPGFDCFIFRRELLNKLLLENICLGVSFSEVALVHNFIAFANRLKLVDDLHLTFHIGTEVMPPLHPEFYRHNRNEFEQKIYPLLKPYLTIKKYPYSELPFQKRIIKWALNPSFRTHQSLEMEGKEMLRRWKYYIDTLRFSLLEKIK